MFLHLNKKECVFCLLKSPEEKMQCLGKCKVISQSEDVDKLCRIGFQNSSGPHVRNRISREVQFLINNLKWIDFYFFW